MGNHSKAPLSIRRGRTLTSSRYTHHKKAAALNGAAAFMSSQVAIAKIIGGSAAGFLDWAVSVDAPIAVVEAVPPVTATVTASKEAGLLAELVHRVVRAAGL